MGGEAHWSAPALLTEEASLGGCGEGFEGSR